MRSRVIAPVLVLVIVAAGAAACGSSGPSASATAAAHKRLFCKANDTLDQASANAGSVSGFLTVLKTHPSQLATIMKDAPAGRAGSEARALAAASEKAAATGNINVLNTPALTNAGSDIDTYCGVDGNGNPLPSYFSAGKGSAFCATLNSINNGTLTATSVSDILSFLKGHQSLLSQGTTELSGLPSGIKADAQNLLDTTRSAISANNAALLATQAVETDLTTVNLYCGINS